MCHIKIYCDKQQKMIMHDHGNLGQNTTIEPKNHGMVLMIYYGMDGP